MESFRRSPPQILLPNACALAEFGFPVLDVALHQRVIYAEFAAHLCHRDRAAEQ